MNLKKPTKLRHKQTSNKQKVNTQQNLKSDSKKNPIKFCWKQSKRAENVNADPVGVSPNGCLENKDPLRPQSLKRKTPFYVLVLPFYFNSNKRVFFYIIHYSILNSLIPHNRGFS